MKMKMKNKIKNKGAYINTIDIYLFTWYFSIDPLNMQLIDKCLLMPFHFNINRNAIHNSRIILINKNTRERIIFKIKLFNIQNTIYYAIWIRGEKYFSEKLDIITKNMDFNIADIDTWTYYKKYNYETAVIYNANILQMFKTWYGINLEYDMNDFLELSEYYNNKKYKETSNE